MSTASTRVLPKFTDRYRLGREGVSVSPICLGMVRHPETVQAAFRLGCNFFFLSADLHWSHYEGSRQGLLRLLDDPGVRRGDFIVAVASYTPHPPFVSAAYKEVLEVLERLEYIDVLVAGGVFRQDMVDRIHHLRSLVESGVFKAKAIGAAFHDRIGARVAIQHEMVDIAYVRYNPSHPGADTDLFPHIAERHVPTYAFTTQFGRVSRAEAIRLTSANHWVPEPRHHYLFAMSQPRVDGLLCSPQGEAQLQALVDTLDTQPLTDDQREHMFALSALHRGKAEWPGELHE